MTPDDEWETYSPPKNDEWETYTPQAPAAPAQSADEAMASPEGEKLRGQLQHEANRRLTEETGVGPGYAALTSAANTAFLNAPRNAGAWLRSIKTGKPFSEEYDYLKRLDEAAAEQNPKSALAGNVAGVVGQAAALPTGAGLGFLGRTGLGALTGGTLEGVGTYLDTKNIDKSLENAAWGTALGAAASPAVELAGAGARKVGEKLGMVAPRPQPMTRSELFQAGHDAYQRAEQQGVMLKPDAIKGLYDDIQTELAKKAYTPKLTPELQPALDELLSRTRPDMSGRPNYTTLAGLDIINQMARHASSSINPQSRKMGGIFHQKLDDFLENLQPQHYISGNGPDAVSALKEGREMWKRARKTEELENRLDSAVLQTAATGSGGNINNKIRQQIVKILDQNTKRPGRWTPDEIAAMRRIVKPGIGGDAARLLGKLSPGGNGLTMMLELGAALHNPGVVVAPMIGHLSKVAADRMTHANFEHLHNLVRSGGRRANLPYVGPGKMTRDLKNIGISGGVSLMNEEERPPRASGGRVCSLDGCATRAHRDLANELRPLMEQPDEAIANALRLAK